MTHAIPVSSNLVLRRFTLLPNCTYSNFLIQERILLKYQDNLKYMINGLPFLINQSVSHSFLFLRHVFRPG